MVCSFHVAVASQQRSSAHGMGNMVIQSSIKRTQQAVLRTHEKLKTRERQVTRQQSITASSLTRSIKSHSPPSRF